LRKNTSFLVLGILILVIGTSLATMEYMSIPQKREWTVNYSFPGNGLDTKDYEGKSQHYNIGGVYSMAYSHRDELMVVDYGAPYYDHEVHNDLRLIDPDRVNRTMEAQLLLILTDIHNYTLEVASLDIYDLPIYYLPYIGQIQIYLGSPLSLDEYYYGNWNVTFRLYHNPNLRDIHLFPYDFLVFGFAMILAGISVITISLRRISRD
jgi:hypothetical protein